MTEMTFTFIEYDTPLQMYIVINCTVV